MMASASTALPGASARPESVRPSVVSLTIREKAGLQASYMRFVQGGGIFVLTTRQARIGDELYLILSLLNDPTRHAVSGKVVWVTPAGSTGRSQGVGVQFARNEVGEQLKLTIESLIDTESSALRPSHTV